MLFEEEEGVVEHTKRNDMGILCLYHHYQNLVVWWPAD